MDWRRIPKRGKRWSPYEIQKVHFQSKSKKAMTFVVTGGKNDVVKTVSLVTHRGWDAISDRPVNLSLWQVLLEWNFPSTNKTVKVEMTNGLWTRTSYDKLPGAACAASSAGCQLHASAQRQRPERTLPFRKPSPQDTGQTRQTRTFPGRNGIKRIITNLHQIHYTWGTNSHKFLFLLI